MSAIDAPFLVDIIRRTLPEGVQLSIHEHTEEHYEDRFIQDPFLNSMKMELNEMYKKRQKEIASSQETKESKEQAKEQKKLAELYSTMDDEDD